MENVNISDLQTNATATGTGFSNPNEEINLGYNSTVEDVLELRTPEAIRRNRIVADFTGMEEELSTPEPAIEDSILGPGGEFEEYLAQQTQDIMNIREEIDAHNREVAAILGEDVPEVITDEDVERSKGVVVKDDEEPESDIINADDYVDPLEEELDEVPVKSSILPKTAPENLNITPVSYVDPENVSFEIDDEDMKELEEDETDSTSTYDADQNLKDLQAEITKKIAPVSTKLNISTFTRSNKAVRANNVIGEVSAKAADWALFNSGKKISMKNFSGTTIDNLANIDGLSRTSIVQKRYKIFYDHIVSENKPKSLEEFVKSTSFLDNDHLYMAAYIASFAGANYIPIDCPKCQNTFLTEDIPMNEMYKFEDDKSKERFDQIMRGEFGEIDETYAVEYVPISDKFCIGFREPSIYKMLFETSYLDDKFTTKYDTIISVLSYIDEILYIDTVNNQLIPIDYKRFPSNRVKDIKSRIIEYSKIINSLSPDEYNIIAAYINAINSIKGTVKYQIPETTCPQCGAVIPARETTAEGLVFMRHQLAALATTSIN